MRDLFDSSELFCNPRIQYETALGLESYVVPDAVVILPEKILLIEVKYKLSHWAWFALREMYGPVTRQLSKQHFGNRPVCDVVISNWNFQDLEQVPDLPFPTHNITDVNSTGWWSYKFYATEEQFNYYAELEQ